MQQATLFGDAADTVPSPLCSRWDKCTPRGRAVLGASEDHGGCVNRSIRCLTCGCTGVESVRKDV